MKLKKRNLPACLTALALILVTACSGSGGTDSPSAKETNAPNPSATDKSSTAAPADPFGKYDPPIEVTTVRIVDDTLKYKEGDTLDQNIWTKAFLDELGIKVKNLWVVSGAGPGGQGEQKMNVSIASGDLPEFIPVNARQLKQLVDADLVMEVADIYEKYAAPFTKEVMNQDGPNALKSATFDGKLMGIPNTGSAMDGAALVWVRSDWLKKLNLPEPKTMDDVFKISEAFTNQDPDGNNKKDTVGLAINKDLYGGYAGVDGFFNGYHAYPRTWNKDASGKLVYGSVQPEMKAALLKLQELYKAGQLDREFGVKDQGKVAETASSGKNGLHFGQMWNPLWPLQANRNNDNNAQWQAYPLVSIDDKPAKPQTSMTVQGYYAVRKDAKHPEALMKLINLFVEKGWGKTANPAEYFTKDGIEKFKYSGFQAWPATKNLDAHLHVTEALKSGETSKLNPEELDYHNKIKEYLDKGNNTHWGYDRVFGETGSFLTINKYVKENLFMQNQFYGAPTPTQVEKGATLDKMEVETFTKIIMGEPIELFDKFVEDWKKTGGDAITKEVNDWAANQK